MLRIDAVAEVISPNAVTSPISGRRAAFGRLEVLEADGSLGCVILGDLVRFAVDGHEVLVPVRRAQLRTISEGHLAPLSHAIAEIVPLLAGVRSAAVLSIREHLFARGDRLWLRALVDDGVVREVPSIEELLNPETSPREHRR